MGCQTSDCRFEVHTVPHRSKHSPRGVAAGNMMQAVTVNQSSADQGSSIHHDDKIAISLKNIVLGVSRKFSDGVSRV